MRRVRPRPPRAAAGQVIVRGVAAKNGSILLPTSYFAHDILLVNEKLRDMTDAIAMTFVQVHLISVDDIYDALSVFPMVSGGSERERGPIRRGGWKGGGG